VGLFKSDTLTKPGAYPLPPELIVPSNVVSPSIIIFAVAPVPLPFIFVKGTSV
jgi:hypothetical protein